MQHVAPFVLHMRCVNAPQCLSIGSTVPGRSKQTHQFAQIGKILLCDASSFILIRLTTSAVVPTFGSCPEEFFVRNRTQRHRKVGGVAYECIACRAKLHLTLASHGGQGCIQRHRTEGTGCSFRSATHHAARMIETAGGTARGDAVPPKNAELPFAWMLACHARPDLCALPALRAMPLLAVQADSHSVIRESQSA